MKYLSFLLGLLLLVSCGSDDSVPVMESLEIHLYTGVGGIEADTRGEGVISLPLTANLPISLIRLEKPFEGNYPAYKDKMDYYAADIYVGEPVETKNDPKEYAYRIAYAPYLLYYLPDGGDTRFMGWYPRTEPAQENKNTVSIEVDGSTDILLAQPVDGNKNNHFGGETNTLTFRHVLTQVVVHVQLTNKEYAPLWGDITAITFADKQQPCVLTLPDPQNIGLDNMVVAEFPTKDAMDLTMRGKGSVTEHATLILADMTARTEVGYAMFAPHAKDDTEAVLEVKIFTTVTGEDTPATVRIPYAKENDKGGKDNYLPLQPGYLYNIYLEFSATKVEFTGISISDWTNNIINGGAI